MPVKDQVLFCATHTQQGAYLKKVFMQARNCIPGKALSSGCGVLFFFFVVVHFTGKNHFKQRQRLSGVSALSNPHT